MKWHICAFLDIIMTCLDANDNIIQTKYTFFVELSAVNKTKKLWDMVTNRPLLAVCELGNWCSSTDGFVVVVVILRVIV